MEKNMKKNVCVWVCESVSLRCTVEINTVNQLYFNKINLKNRNK